MPETGLTCLLFFASSALLILLFFTAVGVVLVLSSLTISFMLLLEVLTIVCCAKENTAVTNNKTISVRFVNHSVVLLFYELLRNH